MPMKPTLRIQASPCPDKALALAERLGLPLNFDSNTDLNAKSNSKNDFALGWWLDPKATLESQRLKLALFPPTSGPVYVDFVGGKKNHRRQFGGGKGQPLAKAVAIQNQPRILDATAGMGGDAFVFASLGCKVTLVERSPIIAALLADALERAQQPDVPDDIRQIAERMTLVNADAAAYLTTETPAVEVVYLDPMYPEKKKTAAAKKDMQALQALVGPDMDSDALLAAALSTAEKRVVVKRPKGAPPLKGSEPTAAVQSPNTRYDLYSIKQP
ncbi:MAG: class I SAM-dependent methyltransferase [Hydrogenovibrio sp.]